MRFRRIVLLAFVFLSYLLATNLSAQQFEIKNVRFRSDGETVVVTYDLLGEVGKKFKTSLKLSDDNGLSFKLRPKTTTGDVGKNITAGKNKKIIWYMNKDFPGGLEGDRFVFAVEAELQKNSKWPFYALGGGAIGAALFFLTQSKKEEPSPTTGSIIIEIPN